MYQRSIPVAASSLSGRIDFIRKTYFHIFLFALSFIGLEYLLLANKLADALAASMNGVMVVSSLALISTTATFCAHNLSSKFLQYGALILFIILKTLIFIPVLYVAEHDFGGGAVKSFALASLLSYGSLLFIIFGRSHTLSYKKKALAVSCLGVLTLVLCSLLFGANIGVYFTVFIVFFESIVIMFNADSIIYNYGEDDYVAAAMQLLFSPMLFLWYVFSAMRSKI